MKTVDHDSEREMILGNLKPNRPVARQVGKSRAFVRELVEQGLVTAIRFGGSEKHPRLRVDPAEVEEAILEHCRC